MKNKIFYFILGALIFGSIGVYASYKYNAKDVSYNDTDVESAINKLYSYYDIDLCYEPSAESYGVVEQGCDIYYTAPSNGWVKFYSNRWDTLSVLTVNGVSENNFQAHKIEKGEVAHIKINHCGYYAQISFAQCSK